MSQTQGRTLVVHKDGAEGSILVDHLTGKILTPIADRPDWAAGLASAVPQERITFYMQRFGETGPQIEAIKNADAVAMQDLSWVGVDAKQAATELEADHDYRLELVGKVLGVDAETGAIPGTTQERELAMETSRRTPEEQQALEQATRQGFPEQAAQADQKQASGK